MIILNWEHKEQRWVILIVYGGSWNMGSFKDPILDPLLFIIFLNDIFFFTKHIKIASYADDNTDYAVEDST